MKFTYVGRKLIVTDGMKSAVEGKISKVDNYFDSDVEAKVVMSAQKDFHKIEISIYVKDLIIRADEVDMDMYIAIDKIVDKIERKIRKLKTRLQKKNHKSIRYDLIEAFDFDEVDEPSTGEVVKRKQVRYKPMSEEEAVMQLELLHHDFYVYKNLDGIPTVIYRRKDGNYGVIETE